MEELLIFYNRWILLVEEIRVGPGAPSMRLLIEGTQGADGSYLNPQPGFTLDASGVEWRMRLQASFDLQPYQSRRLERQFEFSMTDGLAALVMTEPNQPAAFRAFIRIRCVSKDPDIRKPRTPLPWDFTIPEGRRDPAPHR